MIITPSDDVGTPSPLIVTPSDDVKTPSPLIVTPSNHPSVTGRIDLAAALPGA